MSGNEFAAWYEREATGVCRTLSLALGDARLAEECTAEAFARAWADWPRVQQMASPAGWVYRVGLNHARSTLRRRGRAPWTRDRADGASPAPAEPDRALWSAVAKLSPRAREAVALRYIADLAEADIAELMGIARGTVAATLHRARRDLAELLTDMEGARR